MFANMDEETLLYACKVLVENSMKNKMNLNSSNSGQKAENLEKNFNEIKSKDNAPERKLSDEEIEADERKKIKEEEQKEREEKLRENVRKKYAEEKAAKEKKAEKIKAERAARRKKEEEKEKKSQWSEEEFKIRKEELENKKKEIGKKKEEIKDKEEEIKKKKEEMKNSGKNIWEQKEEIKKQENEVRKEEKMIEKQEREVEKQEQEIKKYEELQIDGPVELFGEEYKEESNIAEKDKELALKNNAKMVATLATAETKQKIEKEKELNETDKKDEKDKKGGLFGKFKSIVKESAKVVGDFANGAAHSMSDGIKDVVGEKKKSFNDSKFSKLTGLVFSSDEDKDEVEEKNEEPSFNTKGEFLAWLDAQDTAIKLKNNAKELKRRIERKYNFLKIYNYKSSDEGVKKILGEISSLINEEKTDIYKNIEMLKGEDLEKYLHDTAEVIDNLKLYNKKLDGIFKTENIPELDLDNDEDYHGSSSNWDDGEDKSKLNISKPLETVLKAAGYFMKEIIDKTIQDKKDNEKSDLEKIWEKNYKFNGKKFVSFQGDLESYIKSKD